MKRSSLTRTTPLQRTVALGRVPFARSALHAEQAERRTVRRPRVRDTGPDEATVAAVLERDGHACLVCGGAAWGRRGVDYSIHHRRLRSHGVDNTLPNLVTLCGSGTTGHHGWAHHHRTQAEELGLIVRSGFDVLEVPVFHHAFGRVFLLADGSWSTRPASTSPTTA